MSASLLRRLVEAGTPDDLIDEVAELLADVRALEKARAKNAARQARFKAAHSEAVPASGNVSNVTDVSNVTTPFLDKETSPRPPKEINPNPGRTGRAREGSRLPEGWRPAKLNRETVAGQIIETRGQEWARRTLETFDNHWRAKTGKDAAKADWQKAWANWVIEQDRRDGQQRKPANDGSGLGPNARAAMAVFGAPH